MRKSIAAVLLSALVFPGAGHIYLRSYARGLILIAISLAALADFMRRAWHEAELIRQQLFDEINAGGVIDLEALITQTMASVHRIDSQPFTMASFVLLACWLAAVIDSYRIGKKIEEASNPS